jgi:hypothetical protein
MWKCIKGYEGIYKVSEKGEIRSIHRVVVDEKGSVTEIPSRTMTQRSATYKSVKLSKDGIQKDFYVHRIVAEVFCSGKCDEKNVVNHIDNDKYNNHYLNLEWVSPRENTKKYYETVCTIPIKRAEPKCTKRCEWKTCKKGFSNYQVSKCGCIRNKITNKVLKPFLCNEYFRIQLVHDSGKNKTIRCHRLVASTFLKPREGQILVNHLNGNKQDNSLVNLAWCTNSENVKHAIKLKKAKKDL